MGIRLQAMQLSPYHAGLAEPQFWRLLSVLGFVGRLLSPHPFEFRLAADPRISSESFPSVMGMLHELLRRTGRWRPSGAARGSALCRYRCGQPNDPARVATLGWRWLPHCTLATPRRTYN